MRGYLIRERPMSLAMRKRSCIDGEGYLMERFTNIQMTAKSII